MSAVRVEPVGNPAAVLDAMRRLAAAGEIVVVLGKTHEDGFLPKDLQRNEELLRLLDRTTKVTLRVKDEKRRLDVLHVRERRALHGLLAVLPRRGIAHL